jgi:NADPH2:quinone reductase
VASADPSFERDRSCDTAWERITAAAADINRAVEDGAFRVGEGAGLPLHRFNLEDAPAAHAAVERAAIGKVLITVASG